MQSSLLQDKHFRTVAGDSSRSSVTDPRSVHLTSNIKLTTENRQVKDVPKILVIKSHVLLFFLQAHTVSTVTRVSRQVVLCQLICS